MNYHTSSASSQSFPVTTTGVVRVSPITFPAAKVAFQIRAPKLGLLNTLAISIDDDHVGKFGIDQCTLELPRGAASRILEIYMIATSYLLH